MSNGLAAIPNSSKAKQLRACLLCSVIQSAADFRKYGCPNCDEILQLKGSTDRVQSCTSASYDGVIAVMNPAESWVARWQRTAKYVRGLYAVRVSGTIPDDVEDELVQRGLTYRPRDGKHDEMRAAHI